MKNLAIWGYYGFGNVGDEALLASLVKNLQTENLSIFSGNKQPDLNHNNIIFESRSPKNLFNVISDTDGFILGPGGLLHERKNAKGTWYHLAGTFFSQFLKKPYCAIGQQIGSFSRNSTKYLVRRGLKKAKFIAVRDEKSFDEAANINLSPTLSSDLAFLLSPDEPSNFISDKIKKLSKPRFVFAPSVSESYKPDIYKISELLNSIIQKTNGSLILVPFFEGRDDILISDIVPLINSKNIFTLNSPISWQDAFGIFNIVDFSIPMRLHSMIASSLTNTPFLPIVYHEKIKSIGNDLGCNRYIDNLDSSFEIFDEFLNDIDSSKKQMAVNVLKLKKRAVISIQLLRNFIDEIY